jgi:hypothetical protein
MSGKTERLSEHRLSTTKSALAGDAREKVPVMRRLANEPGAKLFFIAFETFFGK